MVETIRYGKRNFSFLHADSFLIFVLRNNVGSSRPRPFMLFSLSLLNTTTDRQAVADVRLVKLHIIHILRALEDGADGVVVAGCLEGDCHFITGNLQAKKRVMYVKNLLKEIGIEPERVEMYNMSSAQAQKFVDIDGLQ